MGGWLTLVHCNGRESHVSVTDPLCDTRSRIVCSSLQIVGGGRFFDKQGRRVEQGGYQYTEFGAKSPYEL